MDCGPKFAEGEGSVRGEEVKGANLRWKGIGASPARVAVKICHKSALSDNSRVIFLRSGNDTARFHGVGGAVAAKSNSPLVDSPGACGVICNTSPLGPETAEANVDRPRG